MIHDSEGSGCIKDPSSQSCDDLITQENRDSNCTTKIKLKQH
jgi:hypothetical protein